MGIGIETDFIWASGVLAVYINGGRRATGITAFKELLCARLEDSTDGIQKINNYDTISRHFFEAVPGPLVTMCA